MPTKTELLEILREARQTMKQIVDTISPDQEIYPTWEIKHMLAHLAGWDEATTASLRSYLAGGTPETVAYRGVDDYNANSVTTRADLPLEHVIREWEIERNKLLEVLALLPEEKMHDEIVYPWGGRGSLADLVHGMAHHELGHAREIKQLLGSQSSGSA